MHPRARLITLVSVLALAVAPATARAADTYVNGNDAAADDSGPCTSPSAPCETIGQGLIKAGDGDTVHVDDNGSTYLESQVIDGGKSLIADNFDTSDNGGTTIMSTIGPTIKVPFDETAGTISGFTLAAAVGPGQETVFLEARATLRDNQ